MMFKKDQMSKYQNILIELDVIPRNTAWWSIIGSLWMAYAVNFEKFNVVFTHHNMQLYVEILSTLDIIHPREINRISNIYNEEEH